MAEKSTYDLVCEQLANDVLVQEGQVTRHLSAIWLASTAYMLGARKQ